MAQAYVELPDAAGEPSKRLLGWQRVALEPGESANVVIRVDAADLEDLHLLEYWDPTTEQWTTPSGDYEISVGGSFDTALSDEVRIRPRPGSGAA